MSTERPRALVVHESMFGNTGAVAAAVVRGLEAEDVQVTARSVNDADASDLDDYDLVVLGAPTHAFSLSRSSTRADAVRQGAPEVPDGVGLREWITSMPWNRGGERRHVAVFDTRVTKVAWLPKSAATRAATLLHHKGYHVVSRPTGFHVTDVSGPLVAGEEDRATAWARELAAELRHELQIAASTTRRTDS